MEESDLKYQDSHPKTCLRPGLAAHTDPRLGLRLSPVNLTPLVTVSESGIKKLGLVSVSDLESIFKVRHGLGIVFTVFAVSPISHGILEGKRKNLT